MRKEVQNVIRSTERLGGNVNDLAMLTPVIMGNAIELAANVVRIAWTPIAGSVDYSVTKVDEVIEMAP